MVLSQLLLSISVMNVLIDVIGILAIIGLGSFMVILVADLIISIFDRHEGVIFNRKKKEKAKVVEEEISYEENEIQNNNMLEYTETQDAEIIPLEEDVTTSYVDEYKAEEEAKLVSNTATEEVVKQVEEKAFLDVLNEAAAIVAEEAKIEEAREGIQEIQESLKTEEVVEEIKEEVAEEVKEEVVEEPKEEKVEEVIEQQPEVIEKIKVVKVEDNAEVKKLRSLRKDILIKRQSSYVMDKENERIAKEYEEKLKELEDLKNFKKRVQKNRASIIQVRNDALKKNNQLIEEKEQLKKEVENLKKRTREDGKPYFTKEYYEAKLVRLQEELKENEKELKDNKKELLPLRRVKKAYDRDTDRVRRKEILVARQKVVLYGVNSTNNIDPVKKEKLDQEVQLLKELKDSVASCEKVLQENKDRIPALEKTNKVLTKHHEKLEGDIESTKEALNWYATNGSKKN